MFLWAYYGATGFYSKQGARSGKACLDRNTAWQPVGQLLSEACDKEYGDPNFWRFYTEEGNNCVGMWPQVMGKPAWNIKRPIAIEGRKWFVGYGLHDHVWSDSDNE